MYPNQETVRRLREEYPAGCRIVLDAMDDPWTKIPIGTQGVCRGVDDAGSIMCSWDCHSSLSVAYGADRAHRVAAEAEIMESLNWLGKRQQNATEGGHCPRCGKQLESFEHHALSRYADITVCDECGQQEALERAGFIPVKPLAKWWCMRENWKL